MVHMEQVLAVWDLTVLELEWVRSVVELEAQLEEELEAWDPMALALEDWEVNIP